MTDRELYVIVGTLVALTLLAAVVTQTGIVGPAP